MPASEIERLIKTAFPDARVEIQDLAGDGDHYAATVVSEAFRGKSRVQQHQMVYGALQGQMGGVLHALALTTSVPDWVFCSKLLQASVSVCKPLATCGSSARPSSLSSTRLPCRTNKSMPNHNSRFLTCWLTTLWLTFNSLAALAKLECRAAASKARRAFKCRSDLDIDAA